MQKDEIEKIGESAIKKLILDCDEQHCHSIFEGCFTGAKKDLLIAKLAYSHLILLEEIKGLLSVRGVVQK